MVCLRHQHRQASSRLRQCSNEAGSGAKNQKQEQAGSEAEASAGSQKLLLSLLLGASVKTGLLFNQDLLFMQQLLSKIYVTTEEPVVKGASVTTEATAIPGAPATTEVQNNSAEAQYNSASASDPVDAEAPAKILIPSELYLHLPNNVALTAGTPTTTS